MRIWQKIIFSLIFILCLFFLGTSIFLWQKIKSFEPIVYYPTPEKSFIYSKEESIFGIESYLREAIEKEMEKLKKEKKDFLYVDLKEMKLSIFKEGENFVSFPVKAKGADWFWGKTPTGVYFASQKFRLAFSSAARVWMPYAIQFYGNYFIHGWPYDKAGRPVSSRVSGGCIRLDTKDAASLFEFVKPGMPILVFDEKEASFLPALSSKKEIPPPPLAAKAILVADLDTGEIILEKEADSEIWAGPATRIMLALAATESVNLEKRIFAKSWMIEGIKEGIIVPGKSYSGQDLLNLLLSQSSLEASFVLSRFLDPEKFISLMNEKARALGLKSTSFSNFDGKSEENKTSLYDAARMIRYIRDYRKFILKIANEFSEENQKGEKSLISLVEMKSLKDQNGKVRSIFVGIGDSSSIENDFKNILEYLQENFWLQK